MADSITFNTPVLREQQTSARWWVLGGLVALLFALFVGRTLLARTGQPPRMSDILDSLIVMGSGLVLVAGYRRLTVRDWATGLGAGLFIGALLPFATLFQPYPFFSMVRSDLAQAILRGSYTAIAALGGLVIMRRGGPVRVQIASGTSPWRALGALAFGAAVGIPLAVLNVFANAQVQGRPFVWQNPLAAIMDAFQPALFEEMVYRLALLGLIWLVLSGSWPRRKAVWLAGVLSLLVHTYAHFSDEFLTQPLVTLIMGAVLGLVWGVPLTLLALRRNLDSAVGFHWIQDFARFWAGL